VAFDQTFEETFKKIEIVWPLRASTEKPQPNKGFFVLQSPLSFFKFFRMKF